MTETLQRYDDTVYDVGSTITDTNTSIVTEMAVDTQVPAGYEDRLGVLVPFGESEQRFRDGVLDAAMLERVANGMGWHNAADIAYYAARALGKADNDEQWTIDVTLIRKSITNLCRVAGDPTTEHYGNDEHILLETIVAMCHLDESWDAK